MCETSVLGRRAGGPRPMHSLGVRPRARFPASSASALQQLLTNWGLMGIDRTMMGLIAPL